MRGYRLSLKAVFAVVILVGVGLAYYRHTVIVPYEQEIRRQLVRQRFEKALYSAGGWMRGHQMHFGPRVDDRWLEVHVAPISDLFDDGVGAGLFDECHFGESSVTKNGLAFLPKYTGHLDFSGTQFGDSDIDTLARFADLSSVCLDGTRLTAPGLERLSQVATELRGLTIDGTALDDPAILLQFPQLSRVYIYGGAPRGSLAVLAEHRNLKTVSILSKAEGLDDLRRLRPDIEIR